MVGCRLSGGSQHKHTYAYIYIHITDTYMKTIVADARFFLVSGFQCAQGPRSFKAVGAHLATTQRPVFRCGREQMRIREEEMEALIDTPVLEWGAHCDLRDSCSAAKPFDDSSTSAIWEAFRPDAF